MSIPKGKKLLVLWMLSICGMINAQNKPVIAVEVEVADSTIYQENYTGPDIALFQSALQDSVTDFLNTYIPLFKFINPSGGAKTLHFRFERADSLQNAFQPHHFRIQLSGIRPTYSIEALSIMDIMVLLSIEDQIDMVSRKVKSHIARNHSAFVTELLSGIELGTNILPLQNHPKPEWVVPYMEDSIGIDRTNSIFWIRIVGSDSSGVRNEAPVFLEPMLAYHNPSNTVYHGCIRARLTTIPLVRSKGPGDIVFNHTKYHLFIYKFSKKADDESGEGPPPPPWAIVDNSDNDNE